MTSMDQGPPTPTSPTPGSPTSHLSPQQSRPRPSSRTFSYGSNRSSESKPRYTESPQDKAKRDSLWKGLSKANPNAALSEDQPGVANLLELSTLSPLRELQHKDAYGNDIVDPDRSNPTRSRMERPLDTIRNFEKAIDDGYKRRTLYKSEPEAFDRNNEYASRRSSYFGGLNGPSPSVNSFGPGGGYYGNQGGYYNRGPPSRQRLSDRMQSDSQLYGHQRPYPQHGYHQSHDTVNTGGTNGSDSTGPWANSTDPSSENSSLDRGAANKPQTPMDGYGGYPPNGYNGPIMEEGGYAAYPEQDGYARQNGYHGPQNGMPPAVPQHRDPYAVQPHPDVASPRQAYARNNSSPMLSQQPPAHMNGSGRRPMQLNAPPSQSAGSASNNAPSPRPEPEKRKSWLSRKFSRKD